jgi:hypothetical protein
LPPVARIAAANCEELPSLSATLAPVFFSNDAIWQVLVVGEGAAEDADHQLLGLCSACEKSGHQAGNETAREHGFHEELLWAKPGTKGRMAALEFTLSFAKDKCKAFKIGTNPRHRAAPQWQRMGHQPGWKARHAAQKRSVESTSAPRRCKASRRCC